MKTYKIEKYHDPNNKYKAIMVEDKKNLNKDGCFISVKTEENSIMIHVKFIYQKNADLNTIHLSEFYTNQLKLKKSNMICEVEKIENCNFPTAELVFLSGEENVNLKKELLKLVIIKVGYDIEKAKIIEIKTRNNEISNYYLFNENTKIIFRNFKYSESVSFGAYEDKIIQKLTFSLFHPKKVEEYGIQPLRGLIIHGASGIGKRTICHRIAHILEINVFEINLGNINNEECDRILESSLVFKPSLVIIKNLEMIDKKSKFFFQIVNFLESINFKEEHGIVMCGITNSIKEVTSSLKENGYFDTEIHMGKPGYEFILRFLKNLFLKIPNNFSTEDYELLARKLKGSTCAEIKLFLRELLNIKIYKIHRTNKTKNINDLEVNLENLSIQNKIEKNENCSLQQIECIELNDCLEKINKKSSNKNQYEIKKVTFDDIGGYDDLKQLVKESVIWPIEYKKEFSTLGLIPPKGILLYGPPGCSKTLLAKAIANETKMNFIPVKGPELISKYVGESEKNIRKLFEKARKLKPCIVFIDEIDSIACVDKNSRSHETRLLATLLTEMDGIYDLNEVIIIGTTNRPQCIDPAIMRPGRLDRHIEVSLPDEKARHKIFEIKTKNFKIKKNLDFSDLIKQTEGFSGAEVASLCQEASMIYFRKKIKNESDEYITLKEFYEALSFIKTNRYK